MDFVVGVLLGLQSHGGVEYQSDEVEDHQGDFLEPEFETFQLAVSLLQNFVFESQGKLPNERVSLENGTGIEEVEEERIDVVLEVVDAEDKVRIPEFLVLVLQILPQNLRFVFDVQELMHVLEEIDQRLLQVVLLEQHDGHHEEQIVEEDRQQFFLQQAADFHQRVFVDLFFHEVNDQVRKNYLEHPEEVEDFFDLSLHHQVSEGNY